MLTTTEAAALLTKRGFNIRGEPIKPDTVKHWCQRGVFPNAVREGDKHRGFWLIPESDLAHFELPKVGNPNKDRR